MSSIAQQFEPTTAKAQRPVFQDPSRRRWTGFLTFAGSASGTVTFLGVMLWLSVTSTPQFTPLQPSPAAAVQTASQAKTVSVAAADLPSQAETSVTIAEAAAPFVLAEKPATGTPAPASEEIIVAELPALSVAATDSDTLDPTVTGGTRQSDPVRPRTYAASASIVTLAKPKHSNSLIYLDQVRQ